MTTRAADSPCLALIVKGYPRLSETFIANEIRGLERRGAKLVIVSLRHPTDTAHHPVHEEIEAETIYLPEYLHHEPGRVWRGLRAAIGRPAFGTTLRLFLSDLFRDFTRNRIRRFGQSLVLAHQLPGTVAHLHAHFLHTPASVAMYAGRLLGLPWSASAHAKDIWTTRPAELSQKLGDAAWVVTCTESNREYLSGLRPDGAADVERVYHGLGERPGVKPVPVRHDRNGGDPESPVVLVSVGRCVPKKGYPVLLDALSGLDPGLHWRLVHVGGGPEDPHLKAKAAALGIDRRIDWRGAQPQEDVFAAYRDGDVFVLPCLIASNGDRDGLPNVLLEAQLHSLPCISTNVSGIPELIRNDDTGLLVPARDVSALGAALTRLIREPLTREALGAAGRERVTSKFRSGDGYDALAEKLVPENLRSAAA